MRNEESQEVFRGHLEECLGHLGASLASRASEDSQEVIRTKKVIADFCGVMADSVSRWFRSDGPRPVGEPLIKMMCYLDMAGYRVIELERMPKVRRHFAELIGFGYLSGEQAAELLGFTTASNLYQVLRGHFGASKDKDQKMWDAWKERREELERKKAQWHERCSSGTPRSTRHPTEEAKPEKRPKSLPRHRAVVSIMEGLLALLEEGSFGTLSESDLTDLRRSADTVLRLSARLNTLSSQLIMSNQRDGER